MGLAGTVHLPPSSWGPGAANREKKTGCSVAVQGMGYVKRGGAGPGAGLPNKGGKSDAIRISAIAKTADGGS